MARKKSNKKADARDKDLAKIKKIKTYIGARLTDSDFEVGDVTFKIKPLSSTLRTHIMAKCTVNSTLNDILYVAEVVRFGVIGIAGLKDGEGKDMIPEYNEVRVGENYYNYMTDETYDYLSFEQWNFIATEVLRLTHMSHGELDRLAFFTVLQKTMIPDA